MEAIEDYQREDKIWKQRADRELFGIPGTPEKGIVREHQDAKAERAGQMKIAKYANALLAAAAAVALVVQSLQLLGFLRH